MGYKSYKGEHQMGKSTRGYCKYCGKEYTRTGMVKHLQTCKRRVDLYEKATETEKYFELLLYGAFVLCTDGCGEGNHAL